MNRVIGLAGRARSGKNTVARFISELTDGPVEEAAFADLIKVSAARTLGIPFHGDDVGVAAVRQWSDDLKLRQKIQIVDDAGQVIHEISGRAFLQRYGTEAHRDLFGEDFWVEAVSLTRPGVAVLVLTDVRFENEAKAIRAAGGEVWRVERPDLPKASDPHPSERPLPGALVDRTLINGDTPAELKEAVKTALSAYGRRKVAALDLIAAREAVEGGTEAMAEYVTSRQNRNEG